MTSLDSFKCRKTLKVGSKTYVYYSLPAAEKNGLKGISKLPYSLKVLLENLLRNEDDRTVKKADIIAVSKWLRKRKLEHEVAFRPARVLMQAFTGVPAGVDRGVTRNGMQALVGTDSHTTVVNGRAVLGWGVGGIEAEACMLGQPLSMLLPEVVGFKLKGQLKEGVTATDLVLTVTQMLRKQGVVGKFVEFFGS